MKNVFATIMSFFFLAEIALAQEVSGKDENIQAWKVAFITKRLHLTAAEAQNFWPLYNQYETELDALRKNHKKEMQSLNEDFSGISDVEVEKLIDRQVAFRQKEIDILKKYHVEFKKALPVKKVALLYKAEDDFKKQLIQQLKQTGNR